MRAPLIWKSLTSITAILSLHFASFASMWVDPDFEEMVNGATLIAVVEITSGGEFTCKAKVIQAIKGTAPTREIEVAGFNNHNWPKDGIEKETLRTGEHLLMFLHTSRDKEQDRSPPEQLAGKWFVPSPSTGDFRIANGKIRGGWLSVSYPHSKPEVDADVALELIRGYVLLKSGESPDKARALIANLLTVPNVKEVSRKNAESTYKAWFLQWLLCAQGAYGHAALSNSVLTAVRSKNEVIKYCAARALPSLGSTPAVFKSAAELIRDNNSFVQAEACRVLLRSDFQKKKVVSLLLKALPKSSPEESGPSNLMDPLQNRHASGQEMIIRALTKLEVSQKAERDLVRLIPITLIKDEGVEPPEYYLNGGLFAALADHFLKFPSANARKAFLRAYARASGLVHDHFHHYFFRDKSPHYLKAIIAQVRSAKEAPLFGVLAHLAASLPPGDPVFENLVIELLQRFKGTEDAERVLAAAIPIASPRVEQALSPYQELRKTSGILPDGRMQIWARVFDITRQAIDLKSNQDLNASQRLDRWLQLLQQHEDERLGYATEYILLEIVRSTPVELRPKAIDELRRMDGGAEFFDAIQKLGGTLSSQEKEELARSEMFGL